MKTAMKTTSKSLVPARIFFLKMLLEDNKHFFWMLKSFRDILQLCFIEKL